jgi:hypothetical protein
MGGAVPSLPNTPSWRGAQLGGAQGQLYLYLNCKYQRPLLLLLLLLLLSGSTNMHGWLYNFIIIVFQRLGILACSGSEFIFWNLGIRWTVGRTPWMGDRPDARPLPTYRTTQHRKMRTHVHASSGIRIHDPSVRAASDRAAIGTGIM